MEQSVPQTNNGFDRINALIATLVGIITFIIFRLTVAQTLSYWDCGEFIATSHILGNPHPPGSPLFILVGRVFDILALVKDVAFRINLVSVVSSTLTTVVAYLIIVRLVASWYTGKVAFGLDRIIAYASGFVGALFMAFCQTNWNNSVEAEVYGLAMLATLGIFWLGLKWFDHRYSPAGQRIVLLVAFLSLLAVGIHMTTFLVVPIVAIFFSLKREATHIDWGIVSGFFVFELMLIFALSGGTANYKIFLALTAIIFVALLIYLRNKIHWPILLSFAALSPIMVESIPFFISLCLWSIVTAVVWFVKRQDLWRLAFLIMIAGAMGFSVHVYIPIRSAQHPIIDENTPSRSFRTFINFLDRKQYGNVSMTERMFERRGSWANQFGDHARMGYWRFFKGQYSHSGVFPLFFLLGVLGLGFLAYKNPAWGSIFIALFLIASVGLVLYMNFADGTRYNPATGDAYQEVRDRDYFFTPAYILFGMAIGLGIGAVMELIRTYTARLGVRTNRLAVLASVVLVLTPIIPIQANYFTNDRSKNRMAYAYAYNLLNSCKKDAILFTSGDNDTFPVWCVQEIYNLRQDVRVVNFSLLNTDWYSWQLKNLDLLSFHNAGNDIDSLARAARAGRAQATDSKLRQTTEFVDAGTDKLMREHLDSLADRDALPPGMRKRVPISLEDDQILWVDTIMYNQTVARPVKAFYDPIRKRQSYLFPTLHEGKALKVSTLMLENIILTNKWKYPIYFSSASGEVRDTPLNLVDRLFRDGMVLRLSPSVTQMAYDEVSTDSLFFKVYDYANLSDTMVAQDENAAGISLSYPERMLDYQMYIMRNGDSLRAERLLDRICQTIPSYWRSRLSQRDMYQRKGDTAKADAIQREMMAYLHGFLNKNPENVFFYQFLGSTYHVLGDLEKAEYYLTKGWDLNHDKDHSFRSLMGLYYEMRRPGDMVRIATQFKEYHADDPLANEVLRTAQSKFRDQMTPPVQVRPTPPQIPAPARESGKGGS